MSTPHHQPPSYLILGAGVFGISTAYRLITLYPSAHITIIDRDYHSAPSRVAASWDWNKVIRADYSDLLYMRLALEARDVFKKDPLYQPYYHESGIFWVCRDAYADEVVDNYGKLGFGKGDKGKKGEEALRKVGIEEAKKMFGGLFEDADYEGAQDVLVNSTSGWANAGDALIAVTKRCIELGVKYVVGDVETLVFEGGRDGVCSGVRTTKGEVYKADKVVVCAGAYTPRLLEQSARASGREAVSAGERIVAGGITTGMVTLEKEEWERFKDMPVGVQGYTAETGECDPILLVCLFFFCVLFF